MNWKLQVGILDRWTLYFELIFSKTSFSSLLVEPDPTE